MRTEYAIFVALSLSLVQYAGATNFFLKDEYIGNDFLQWIWETEDDPTHGRVNYVSKDDAISKGLAFASGESFYMGADHWSVVPPSARGRDSVRITSPNAYDDAVFVLDLAHMPTGCATWPAFWTRSKAGPWPHGGEIDVIEGTFYASPLPSWIAEARTYYAGVNLDGFNSATLHTTPGCTMPPDALRKQTGTAGSTDCNAFINGNEGCGVSFTGADDTYGPSFNEGNGGFYAMAKSQTTGIQVWFWPYCSSSVPSEIRDGVPQGQSIAPDSTWGPPAANFTMVPGLCDYAQHFDAQEIVFDLTFCGDWAGGVWPTSGCGPQTCEDYVNNNPAGFCEAYWAINSLRVYTPSE
ncbi:concanavalin A-like lectin/glucanase domain-containing protein [Lactifluus subvellereus]|nr:concanavalin A-like lectin/glucanase domain-containing protein [Lactifluus subvellereus]